jgi:hypothetical protein
VDDHYKFRPDLAIFGVARNDPGYVYIVEDHQRYKIGKSRSSSQRLKAAKTWLPDMRLIGCKPFWNVSHVEKCFHVGFSRSWYSGEWFEFEDLDDKALLLDGFAEFSDTDRDVNSVDFIYWFNGDGMAEFVIEQSRQKLTISKFLKQESYAKK